MLDLWKFGTYSIGKAFQRKDKKSKTNQELYVIKLKISLCREKYELYLPEEIVITSFTVVVLVHRLLQEALSAGAFGPTIFFSRETWNALWICGLVGS